MILHLHIHEPIVYTRIPFNGRQIIISRFDSEKCNDNVYTKESNHDLEYIIKPMDDTIEFCKSLDKKFK